MTHSFRALVPEEELKDIITKGRNKTLMPAFAKENGGTLTAAQIQVLVNEIKGITYKIVDKQEPGLATIEVVPDASGIAPKWGTPAKAPEGLPSYREPSASAKGSGAGDKKKGAAVFARACATCHGDHGQGIAQGSDIVNTINDRVFLALMSNQVLRRYAITGRPDLGMPEFAERPDQWHFSPLTDPEVTDLVALLASWRGE